jgi:hypothetical protein
MTFATASTRRDLCFCAATALLVGLTGCATLVPRDLTVSQAQLQSMLERQFPREQRWLDVFDVRIARPTLELLPQRNRIAISMDIAVSERIGANAFHAGLSLEHGLRYEPADGTLRLTQVTVQELRLAPGGSPLQGQGARLGSTLAERLLEDLAIHRLDDAKRERLKQAGLGAAQIAVTERGVSLHFLDAPR